MAADHWTHEHHLTPNGWVSGTYRFFGKAQGDVIERPADAVETWVEEGKQKSMWSPETVGSSMVWHDVAVSESKRAAMRAKFKRPF